MALVPNSDDSVLLDETQTRNPTSESLFQKIGGLLNFHKFWIHSEIRFNLNGPFKIWSGKLGVDGIFKFPYNAQIISVSLTQIKPGTVGTSEIDLKVATASVGSWLSIFSTTPKFLSTAPAFASVSLSGGDTGTTTPVLTTFPYNVNANQYIRMDVISTSDGAQNLSVSVIYKARL